MGKITKAIKAISAIVSNPWMLNRVLSDDKVWVDYLRKEFDMNPSLPVVSFGQICPESTHELNPWAFLDGSSLPTDIALLKSLAKRFEKCSYFEIGTWRGESVANVAAVANECFTLNLSHAEILELGYDKKYADLHAFFSKNLSNVTHLYGDSRKFDFEGLQKKFDLIFIDGNHSFDYVLNDTQKVFEYLIHEDSIVVWHDYAYSPERVRPEVMAAVVKGTPPQLREHLYHVSNSMCCIMTKEKLETLNFESPQEPKQYFKVNIEAV